MARAVLEIDADTSGLVAALGDAERAAKRAEDGARRMGGAYRESARQAAAAERAVVNEAQRAVAASARAEQQKIRAARMSADARKRAEEEATRVAADEARKRGLSSEQEARVKQNALERYTRIYEQEERRQTAAAEREARRRQQAWQKAFTEWRRGVEQGHRELNQNVGRAASAVSTGAAAAGGFAGGALGMIRDARQSRAQAGRTIAYAVMGGGGNAADVAATRQRAAAFARDTGMTLDDVATALQVGQQRGSALQPREGQTREQMLDEVFATIREANATDTNAGQLLAARGRLAGLGLRGDSLKDAVRFALRAADLGSVEVDQIIQQGLPGASRLMATRTAALGPGATDEQRQAVALAAFRESVALQEVTGGEGNAPRNMANTLANLQTFLRTPRRQEAILNNIRTAEEQANVASPEGRRRRESLRALREAMFETDPTRTGGAMRMRAGLTPLELAARLTEASGGDANAAMSLLAGSGQGNPQSLLANMRGVLEFLGRTNATGQTGGARVTEMMTANAMTDAEIEDRRRVVESDDMANFNRLEETRLEALTQNTQALQRFTDRVDGFSARNPIATGAAVLGGGGLVHAIGAKLSAAVGVNLLGQEGTFATLRGRDVTGRQLSIGERAFRASSMVLGGALAGPAGFLASAALGGARDVAGAAPAGASTEVLGMLQRAITDLNTTLRGGVTATVTPTDAAQASSQRPLPPTPAR